MSKIDPLRIKDLENAIARGDADLTALVIYGIIEDTYEPSAFLNPLDEFIEGVVAELEVL